MSENENAAPQSPPPWAGATDDRRAQMFPILTSEQIGEIAPFGTERRFAAGELLWSIGERGRDFHVVLEGTVEIVRRDSFGRESVITTHGPGSYSGETVMLTDRGAVVAGRAEGAVRALAVPSAKLRELMLTHARLGEIIMRSFILRRMRLFADHASDLLVIGSRHAATTLHLLEFLTRNSYPHTFVDLETAVDISALLHGFEVRTEDTPIVITSTGEPLRNPSLRAVADRLGLSYEPAQQAVYDAAVIGAGPAGLVSAVYAASEGLDVIVLDPVAPGGQAGTSSKIENYLGFPTGISGQALAGRAYIQAQKFGAKIMIPAALARLDCGNPSHQLTLDNGERIRARTVVIASGAKYRKPPLEGLEKFEGVSVYYSATHLEAQYCRNDEVVVIGGGNSAGQAAVYLAESAKKVYVLVRSQGLAATMSQYLIRRIETMPNIEFHNWSEVISLEGGATIEGIRWRHAKKGVETSRPVKHLFVFIGATPNTDFLPPSVLTDAKGFICTGAEVTRHDNAGLWPLERAPFPLETSCPGVFAVGDARATSTKRVASAVGEGSTAVQYIHQFLAMRGASI